MGTESEGAFENKSRLRPAETAEGRSRDAAHDTGSGMSVSLGTLWAGLLAGRSRVTRAYSDERFHYLELEKQAGTPLAARDLDLLLPVLLGVQQKVVAADASCSISRVATAASRSVRQLGLDCKTNDVPMLLVMMVRAARQTAPKAESDACHGHTTPDGRLVLRVERPDSELAQCLSPCEWEVLRLRVDGLSLVQIAELRKTSARTVANQVANAYTKLGVSGRLELLSRLVTREIRCDRTPRGRNPRLPSHQPRFGAMRPHAA